VTRKQTVRVLWFYLAVCFSLGGCALFSNLPPVGSFDASRTRGSIPLDVRFDASSSYDQDGHITRWDWDFGDGGTDTGPIVIHRFVDPDTYLVRLSVRDNRRATSVTTISIEVVKSNEPPVAEITITPPQGQALQLITFDASGSTDEDGKIEEWAWDLGDGHQESGELITHRYMTPGTYTVQLVVRDGLQGEDIATAEIVITESSSLVRHFQWDYATRHFNWTVSIPSALYYEYRARRRGDWDQRDYDDYVLDPLDDEYLESLVNWIQAEVGTDFYDTVECAFNFVQAAITYSYDPRWYEYPRYPIETLVDETGDCEDTAILYASLVRTLGAGAMLVAVDTNHDGTVDHMITLVPVSQAYADTVTCTHGCTSSFWTYGSQLYAFAETTGEPDLAGYYFQLGCDPWGLTAVDFKITWDVSSLTPRIMPQRWEPSPASGE
jgi:PKD repeat protein